MTANIVNLASNRQRPWRQRKSAGRKMLHVDVDYVRLVEWLKAAQLLDPADEDSQTAVASAFWRAAELSIIGWEYEIR